MDTPLFDHTVEHTNQWLKDIEQGLGLDDRVRAWHALKAVMTTLRDRLPIEEVADLSAQLPLLVRAVFFEAWDPRDHPRIKTRDEFVASVRQKLQGQPYVDAEDACRAVMSTLRRQVSPEELEQVRGVLPSELKPLLGAPLA